ncbi:uncharacterized protein LOC107615722 [Arachis ipaensis]|uniref:uncharacterized protein LOC107615722 n=1 Tax=Arachis ipaensis TaxID=130454 RepID=UPI0007AF3704|nr:uncharacterized protein LOC107615722 [Arachis ipaensis]
MASSSVPVYEPAVQLVASPSFAVDLNDGVGDEVGSFDILPNALEGVPPVGVGDGVLGDADEDDVEPDTIEDDSGDEVRATGPALAGGGSSSGTQQYPPHFSLLDLDAMRHEGDGNSNILPVAFALVEGENAESWRFFLSHFREHVTPQPGLLVISDRHNGIKAALEAPDGGWLPPSAYRAFCIRHVAANFALTFKGKDARRLLVNVAYAKTEVEFDYWFDILRSEDPAMCDWANRIDYSLWTQHRDESRRFGHMTTNISECVNSILKGVRNLPVASLVKATYCRLAELFVRNGREAEAQIGTGQQFKTTPTGSFSLGTYRVSLASRTCDYGYFQALYFPCQHALACCAYSRLTWTSYVHSVYQISSVFSVYRMGFTPPIPEGFWPPYDGPTMIPDPDRRHAREGRPRSTRIQMNMDEADPNRPKRCNV